MLPTVQSIIHAEGVPRLRLRLRFDQEDVRFELRKVRCGLPTILQESRREPANERFVLKSSIEVETIG
jgi:hypothetical protein